MFMTRSDENSLNQELRDEIDQVYQKYFHVKQTYTCQMHYDNVTDYGFTNYLSGMEEAKGTRRGSVYLLHQHTLRAYYVRGTSPVQFL